MKLDTSLDGESKTEKKLEPQTSKYKNRVISNIMKYIGPAFLIAMACLDPGNLSGDIAVGQKTNCRLLWLLIVSGVLCYYYQSLALTIGIYTQRDLSQLCKLYYPKRWSLSIWLMAEIALIASDTQEVLGIAISLKIFFGIELFWGVLVSLILVFAMLYTQNKGQNFFEKIFGVFILVMAVCFFTNFFVIEKDWLGIVWGFVPTVHPNDFGYAISLLGAILMPQNLFLHSTLVNTRKINRENKLEIKDAQKYFNLETAIVIVISMIINFFIIITFSQFSSDEPLIKLEEAGSSLEKLIGPWAKYMWAVGLFSSGQSATMAGAITGQYIMDGFLDFKISRKMRVLVFRFITLFPCLIISLLSQIEIVYIMLNVVQIIQLPFVLIPLFNFAENQKIMNGYKVNRLKLNLLKVVSLGFTVINIAQIIMNIPNSFQWMFWFSLGMGAYLMSLIRLKNIRITFKEAQETELELMSSLQC